MSGALPSLEAQAARWRELNGSIEARMLAKRARDLIEDARSLGMRVEIRQVSHACSMGATHEEIIVTPSRDGYQSTT